MKNTQLRKSLPRKKVKNRVKTRITKIQALRTKAEKIYKGLPKWARDILAEDKDIALDVLVHDKLLGFLDHNPQTGKPITMRQSLLTQAEERSSHANLGIKKKVFTAFRRQDFRTYTQYNNYMYRNGYSSAKYFYQNAEISREKGGYRIIAKLELPKPKTKNRQALSELEIVFTFITSTEYDVDANLYF